MWTCSFMPQPIMLQQCSASSHVVTGHKLYLMLTSKIRIRKMVLIAVILTTAWLLVLRGLVWVFLKLLLSWKYHAQWSLEFTHNGVKNKRTLRFYWFQQGRGIWHYSGLPGTGHEMIWRALPVFSSHQLPIFLCMNILYQDIIFIRNIYCTV